MGTQLYSATNVRSQQYNIHTILVFIYYFLIINDLRLDFVVKRSGYTINILKSKKLK